MKSKTCTQCSKLKFLDDFYNDKSKKDGKSCKCKECIQDNRSNNEYKKRHKKYMKRYSKENKEKLEEYYRNWRKNNKNKKKLWYVNNREKSKKYNKKSRNKEALYTTYAHQINWIEKVRRDPKNREYLQIKCTNSECRKWFNPTVQEVCDRIKVINGKSRGAQRFYCSEECKQNCSIYGQKKYPKGFINRDDYRIDQKEWAELVKQRDNYECQRCCSIENLIAHHIEGLNMNPIMSADIDLGITLCKKCDRLAHSEIGCRPIDLIKENICRGNL